MCLIVYVDLCTTATSVHPHDGEEQCVGERHGLTSLVLYKMVSCRFEGSGRRTRRLGKEIFTTSREL